MGRVKDLLIKLQKGSEITLAEKAYVISQRVNCRSGKHVFNNGECLYCGTEEDYMYQEALKDIEELNKIDPPDEE